MTSCYQFEKMHGLGNDFMLIDADCQNAGVHLPPTAETIRRWSDRRYGVGFDQLVYLFKQDNKQHYQFYNADGSQAQQCGNGQRAIALYLQAKDSSLPLLVWGDGGPVELAYKDDNHISASLQQKHSHEKRQLSLLGTPITAYIVDVGNPHCVFVSADVKDENLAEKAALIGAYFPEGVNVEAMQIISDNHVNIRIYERGAGETQACGSGAAAAALVLRYYFQGQSSVRVSMLGGDLRVSLTEDCDKITLIGPAQSVYQGQIYE